MPPETPMETPVEAAQCVPAPRDAEETAPLDLDEVFSPENEARLCEQLQHSRVPRG